MATTQLVQNASSKDSPELSSHYAVDGEGRNRSGRKPVRLLDLVRRVRIHIPPAETNASTKRGAEAQLRDSFVDVGNQPSTSGFVAEEMQVSKTSSNDHKSDGVETSNLSADTESSYRRVARTRVRMWTCCCCGESGTTWMDIACYSCGHIQCTRCDICDLPRIRKVLSAIWAQ